MVIALWARAALTVVFLLLIGCDAIQTPVSFDVDGGDAWTFSKQIDATVPPGACETVAITSPRATITARPIGRHVSFRVPLQPGDNLLRAECRSQGRVRGAAAEQHWFVRLTDRPKARIGGTVAGTLGLSAGDPDKIDPFDHRFPWHDEAIVYGVVPPLFGPRGFADVTARLDELTGLGVTVLWLSPITAAASGDFGYALTDPFRLRPDFGSEADLRELIAAAHSRDLRVILDFVANHFSDRHAYFADSQARGRRSPYFDFFERSPEGAAEYYFDWRNLENLNYRNPELQRLMIEAFAYWVREFDVDGFRVDAAWGPRDRAPEFWPIWRDELKRIKPDLLLLAEASARDPYYVRNGFDAAYDWSEKLGEWPWRDAFEDESRTVRRLRAAIGQSLRADDHGLVFRFLNNNDTGPRFITRYGLDRTRVAAAMLLTLPGLPSLYTGDETGAAFQPYEEGPPITRSDPNGLRSWYARLIRLRHDYPALRSRQLRFLDIAPKSQVLAYLRPAPKLEDSVLVLLNYGASPVRVTLPSDLPRAFAPGRKLRDLVTHEILTRTHANSAVALAGYGARALKGE